MRAVAFVKARRSESARKIRTWCGGLLGALLGLAVTTSLVSAAGDDGAARNAGRNSPPSALAFYGDTFGKTPTVQGMSELGRRLFFDRSLSASGKMACATCHDPKFAFGPPNARSVQPGGLDGKHAGIRAVPSLRYLQSVPPFTEHYEDDEQGGADQGPTGGHTWDGRADTTHDQARLPLLSPFEMANASVEAVVQKVEHGAYADRFRDTFGADVFGDSARAFKAVLLSLEVFQQSPDDFYPYSSKYDGWLRRRTELTAQEKRGLALFNDPKKGNCASCHPSGIRASAFPQFTDFGFVALGVPRNRNIPANSNPAHYDLGLCGPERTDLTDHKEYCGLFRTPSLRNVALRRTFFHNGVFHSLRQVLEFYVERDLRPKKWYAGGRQRQVRLYDDLQAQYHGNVNREPPFDRKASDAPALSKSEIEDVIAFLETLTDADAVGLLSTRR
jgi:cytochrome c peroxidase